MSLTIEVIGYKEVPLSTPFSATFDQSGGTLGRSPDNHLVLEDEEKVVSTIHGIIEYENGAYYYMDNSLNGTHILNGANLSNRNKWVRHEKIQLNDKDQLQIGDYDLTISIEGDNADFPDMALNNEPSSMTDTPEQPTLTPSPAAKESSPAYFFDRAPEKPMSLDPSGDVENEESFDSDKSFYNTPERFVDGEGADHFLGLQESLPFIDIEDNLAINENFDPPKPVLRDDSKNILPEGLTLDDFFDDEESSLNGSALLSADGGNKLRPASTPLKHTPPPPPDKKIGSPEPESDPDLFAGLLKPSPKKKPAIPRPFDKPTTAESLSPKEIEKPKFDQKPFSDANVSVSPDNLIDIFFRAAGLESYSTLPENEIFELMHMLGKIFKEFIDGMITILRGRTELKSQLRVTVTTFKATENNPLKFSTTPESAIKTFLLEKNPGFLDAVQSVREGFDDIRNHELAVNAGVQVSLLNILKQFDPDSFSHKIEDKFVVFKKARCWDEYRKAYQDLFEKAIDDFFGKEFVRAYEEQMEKLRPKRG